MVVERILSECRRASVKRVGRVLGGRTRGRGLSACGGLETDERRSGVVRVPREWTKQSDTHTHRAS